MTTDPTKSLAPQPLPPAEKNALTEMLDSDLAQLSRRELLGMLLSSVGLAERKAYLERVVHDKPNGFYDRSLEVGAIPLDLRVPRTRSGDFRPATLPPLYQRGYSEETQSLLLSLLTSGRSLHAVKDALQKMGLSCSQQELDRVATDLMEELELRNTRPLDPDLLALFLDGKYVEFRDGDRLRPACIYVVVGLRRDGKKQILTCLPRHNSAVVNPASPCFRMAMICSSLCRVPFTVVLLSWVRGETHILGGPVSGGYVTPNFGEGEASARDSQSHCGSVLRRRRSGSQCPIKSSTMSGTPIAKSGTTCTS
jgi:hypothetical protein